MVREVGGEAKPLVSWQPREEDLGGASEVGAKELSGKQASGQKRNQTGDWGRHAGRENPLSGWGGCPADPSSCGAAIQQDMGL